MYRLLLLTLMIFSFGFVAQADDATGISDGGSNEELVGQAPLKMWMNGLCYKFTDQGAEMISDIRRAKQVCPKRRSYSEVDKAYRELAAVRVLKTCNTVLPDLDGGKGSNMKVDIITKGGKLSARTTQSGLPRKENVKVSTHKIRTNLPDPQSENLMDLNLGEKIIIHAKELIEEPMMQGKMSVGGIDLKKVRSVKAYQVGVDPKDPAPIGVTTLVETFDAQGKSLGMFLSGFLVTPCQ